MNLSAFCSVPQPVHAVKPPTGETLTLQEMQAALTQKHREQGRTSGLTRQLCEETIRDLEARIKQAQAVDTITVCPECWLDTGAVVTFFGREICPPCAEAEEAAYDEAQTSAYEAREFGRHDNLTSMKDVLAGMGF